jgi:hypothetical protein
MDKLFLGPTIASEKTNLFPLVFWIFPLVQERKRVKKLHFIATHNTS